MTAYQSRVLVVDDDPDARALCRQALEADGYELFEAKDGLEAEALLESRVFDLVLTDLIMPRIGGLDLLGFIAEKHHDTVVVIFTGHGTVDLAKDAIRKGAYDFIRKPFRLSTLREIVRRGLERRREAVSELPGRELGILHELTLGASLRKPMGAFLDSVALSVARSFGADAVRLYVGERSEQDTELHQRGASGASDSLEEGVWTDLAFRAISTGEGVMLADVSKDPLLSSRGRGAVMARPVPGAHGPLGSIVLVRSNLPDPFTERDLKLLSLFAAQAGSYIQNSTMTEELRRRTEELEQIYELAGTFSATLSVDGVLRAIGAGLSRRMSFDALGVVFEPPGSRGVRGYLYSRRDLGPDREAAFRNLLQEIVREDLSRVWSNLPRDRFDPSTGGHGLAPSPSASFSMRLEEFSSLRGIMTLASFSSDSIDPDAKRFLSTLARQAATAISNANMHETSERNHFETIAAFARAVDAKDPYTHDHSRNVAAYSLSIVDYMGLSDRDRRNIRNAALLHDIGKIGVSEAILNKPGALTDEEYDKIKQHPTIGYNILSRVAAFEEIVPAVLYHHERCDGSGYPTGLAGDDIPYHARILAVADVFDAIVSDRVYRPSPGLEFAIEELRTEAGTKLDPEAAYALIDMLADKTPNEILDDYSSEVSWD